MPHEIPREVDFDFVGYLIRLFTFLVTIEYVLQVREKPSFFSRA